MRVLDFIVTQQTLTRDPLCDFSGLVAGSRGYLSARFRFCKEWAGCKRVAVFVTGGKEYPVPLVNNMCEIPAQVLTCSTVQVYVVGQRGTVRITTGTAAFPQAVRQ